MTETLTKTNHSQNPNLSQNPQDNSKPSKKAPDYSATAINLINPPEVKQALDALHERQKHLTDLEAQRANLDPVLDAAIAEARGDIEFWNDHIKKLLKEKGSYQDIEAGEYALIYTAKTPEYHAQPFMEKYTQYVPAVIVQSINPEALKGLIKGGLLNQETLEAEGVITYKVREVPVIK